LIEWTGSEADYYEGDWKKDVAITAAINFDSIKDRIRKVNFKNSEIVAIGFTLNKRVEQP